MRNFNAHYETICFDKSQTTRLNGIRFLLKSIPIILFSYLLTSCNGNEDKSDSQNQTIANINKIDSIGIDSVVENFSENYRNFAKNKEAILALIVSQSKEQNNKQYEKYLTSNNELISKIQEEEQSILDRYYSEDKKDIDNLQQLKERLDKFELRIEELGEGEVTINTKPNFYYTLFKDYTTPDYSDYLQLTSKESESLYSADAGLAISFQELGDRIASWENFMKKHPKSTLKNQILEQYKSYQIDYLTGMDNTPTVERINSDDIFIYPENIQELNRFEKKYPKSPTLKLITIFREHFAKENISEMLQEAQNKQI